MFRFNRLAAAALTAALLVGLQGFAAPRKVNVNKEFAQGLAAEDQKDWDKALAAYEKALAASPSDMQYQIAVQRARFQAGQAHVDKGLKLRAQGQLDESMLEFQRAFTINPGSAVAVQEIRNTGEMIQREKDRVAQTGKESTPEERALTPLQSLRKDREQQLNRILGPPVLKPTNAVRNVVIKSNQPRLLFESLGKYAGINVLWDPAFQSNVTLRNPSVDFQDCTIEEAFDYLGLLTNSYWKPVSTNTIFVTGNDRNNRVNNADQVVQVFYLSNVQQNTELQEIMNAARMMSGIQQVMAITGQNAFLARGEPDQIALIEKVLRDLDRPKAEVVVDIVVMSTDTDHSRQLAAALSPTGINIPANFTPRSGLQVVTNANTTGTTTTNSTTTTGTTTTTGSTATGTAIPLSNLGHLRTSDFSTTLPGALLQAVMSDTKVNVLQQPQVRTVDNVEADLSVGELIPYATGSYGTGLAAGVSTVSPLVSTQFQQQSVGVIVKLTPRVHDNGEISIHVELEVSSQSGTVSLGGLNEPIIAKDSIKHDVRLKEGEVSLIGGLLKVQDTRTVTGTPGLSKIPLLGKLFQGQSTDHEVSELMIALVPHIVRNPEFTPLNLRAIEVGPTNATKLNYARNPEEEEERKKAPSAPIEITPGNANTPGAAAAPPVPGPASSPFSPPGPGAAPAGMVPPALQQLLRPGAASALPGSTAPGPPASSAVSHFAPAMVETAVNGTFTVALVLDGGTDVVNAGPIQLQYSPKLLSITDISPGDLFSRDGQQPMFARAIQNDQGVAVIQTLGRPAGAAGVTGSGTLLLVRFQALAAGTTNVGALNVTARNSQGFAVGASSPQLAVTIK